MNTRLTTLTQSLRSAFVHTASRLRGIAAGAGRGLHSRRGALLAVGLVAAAGYGLWAHPPLQTISRGEVGVRENQLTGSAAEFGAGSVLVLPGLHELRRFSLRDQTYRPASSGAPFQSVEGLSFGIDLSVRYALDPAKLRAMSKDLPDNIGGDVVQPAVQGVIYRIFTRYTVREIFSSRRGEIQQAIEAELKPRLAADGVQLRSVQIGKIELPAEYRQGMDKLLAEELETEKMRYTLELKDKQVKETALVAEADKVRREKAAEASASEQIIAARAQEEAMKHVLPFKQKQIEQRQLEAEAEKLARIKSAEGLAQARRLEASGEADSRQKLADAEVYRLERVGKVNSEQMAREGALISRHPLLIQKTLADKLSDKVQVIIASPPADGGFIGAGLVGSLKGNAALTQGDGSASEGNGAEVQ
ncbi:MAG TPA: SPFH domain-containing protein [Ideonella sp.]|nr:SPFH domain-containing protein [Ideonella sp.]